MIPIAGDDYKLSLPTEYLSVTQMAMFQRCPLQYQFRYVDGLKEPPAVSLVEGSSHHAVMEHNNVSCATQGKPVEPKKAFEVFADKFMSEEKQIEDWQDTDCNDVIKRGREVVDTVAASEFWHSHPVKREGKLGIEWEFASHRVAGVPILGYVDLIEHNHVFDYKFVNRHKTGMDAENSLQLMAYRTVTRTKNASFVSVTKKKPTVRQASMPGSVTLKQCDWWVANIVSNVARSISAGNFSPCDPGSWCCSPRWCGYYHRCRGAGKLAPKSLFVQVGTKIKKTGKTKGRKNAK